jgi:murein DD-endopeptidase MepM/ murein hydrolase activator NlpD
MLEDRDPVVREAAANALCHIGDDKALEALKGRLEKEKDPCVLASIEAAARVLESGGKPYEAWAETLDGPEGAKRVEWKWVHKGSPSFNRYEAGAKEVPVAESFGYPVSAYKTDLFCPSYPRRSFGAGDTHAGEDCAWFREGCSYYAIADGVVRMVQGAGGDWGFLLVLEHLLPSGDYVVSVYGHAAWDVLVKPGDAVKKGQKIATQGLSCAVENGGYGSHIHFGIGDGPFRRPRKHAKGETLQVESGGKPAQGKIVRFVYSKERKGSRGWPLVAAVVQLPDRSTVEVAMEEEEAQDELAWMQAYVQKCEGWLNPETFLPEKVEGKKK